MGYGSYSAEAHETLVGERAALPTQEVFKQRSCHPLMNPKGVRLRECRDSADHPTSLGIVFALDVTGSMGHIPELLAREELPAFMRLLGAFGVTDPAVLFCAFGDALSDQAPLQVGQFEATAELMDQWLTWSWLEGGGGPGMMESYELALYFLAEHTATDNWEKRGRRGFLFLTGDEHPYPSVPRTVVESVIGDRVDEDIPTEAVIAALQERWEPFFLIPDPGRRARVERRWKDLLGDHVITLEAPGDTAEVCALLVALGSQLVPDLDAAAERLRAGGVAPDRIGPILKAVRPYAATLGRTGESVGGEPWWKRFFGR